MEKKEISINGKRIIFAEVSEDASRFDIDWKFLIVDLWTPSQKMISIPEGQWQVLGDSRNIKHPDLFYDHGITAETWNELKEVNGIADTNPLGEEPDFEKFRLVGRNDQERKMIAEDTAGNKPSWASIFRSNYQDRLTAWKEAQTNVKRYMVLISYPPPPSPHF